MNSEETAEVVIDHLAKFGQLKNPKFKEELKSQIKDLLDFEERKLIDKYCSVCGKDRKDCR